MDYLPAIQFAAALNLGYIIPDILKKMYKVLENIDSSYKTILDEVKNKAIVKNTELSGIHIIETKDDQSTKKAIDSLSSKLMCIKEECDNNASKIKDVVDRFVLSSGYRSVFLYSALFSVFALLIIPFCHQHSDVWTYRVFFYVFSSISFAYIVILFLSVIIKKKDINCRWVLWLFFVFLIVAALASIINNHVPVVIVVGERIESFLSWLSIGVSFLPGVGCVTFLSCLIIYSNLVARHYAIVAKTQFKQVRKGVGKLDEMNDILNGDISIT